ncbi:MAG: multiheme c-type cytochrome, partial [Steroidobacteraceae bacterium]
MTAGVRSRSWLLAGLLALLVAAVAVGWYGFSQRGAAGKAATEAVPGAAGRAAASYVGSQACAGCHAAEAGAWQGSQHERALQHAVDGTVLGNFNDATFEHAGVTSTFFRRGGKYFVRTDGADGKLADFEVKYTFGVQPLQQYLIELPRGHVQALSIAWDTRTAEQGGQRWFNLYANEKIDHRDELHWTRRQQNWNYMCADCHSTDVEKRYDAATDAFATTYAEASVGCEACHGPGEAHLAWAARKGDDATKGLAVQFHERRGVTWAHDPQTGQPRRSTPRTTTVEIEVCAQCHARRAQIAEGYRPGQPFLDRYLPSLLAPAQYHVDGQQQDEVFIWGSWLQSRMHAAGVSCSDCHDPHTQKLRAPGNAVCAQCHEPAKYDATAHHHHSAGAQGSQCVDCHMRRETYMVVDPRRDHSMRVPRPDQTVTLGVPNACNDCHRENDARWAAAQVRRWLGRDARGIESFAAAFAGAEHGEPAALGQLLAIAGDPAQPGIVRASALERVGIAGGYDREAVMRASQDPDPLVRLGAVRMAEASSPQER